MYGFSAPQDLPAKHSAQNRDNRNTPLFRSNDVFTFKHNHLTSLPSFASGLLSRITASRDDDMMKSTMGSLKWDSTSGKGSSGFHSHAPSPGHLTVSEQGLPQAMAVLAVTQGLPHR